MPDNPTIFFIPTDRPIHAVALADNGALAIFYGSGGIALQMPPDALRALAERAVAIADALEATDAATVQKIDAALHRVMQEVAGNA
jgi:hypothetical protein